MRSLAIGSLFFWGSLALELAWPVALPHGSLLFPLLCAAVCWFGDARGIILASAVAMLDWVARPTGLPLVAIMVPLLAVVTLTATDAGRMFRRSRNPLHWIPEPLHLPLMTIGLTVLHVVSDFRLSDLTALSLPDSTPVWSVTCWWPVLRSLIEDRMLPVVVRAVPLSALLSVLIRLLDELGMRRAAARDLIRIY